MTGSHISPISSQEVALYREAVGRVEERLDVVDRRVAYTFAATLDEKVPAEQLPPLWHYGLFSPLVATSLLDADGHPRRGNFLPAVRLPRRMFAGATLRFGRQLAIGREVRRISHIASIEHRSGKSGDLIFVRLAHKLIQGETTCVEEEQTIVYRTDSGKTPPVAELDLVALAPGEEAYLWLPKTTELFRYSAVTFNAHRIHYDLS